MPDQPSSTIYNYLLTDTGNAERLAVLTRDKLRYVIDLNTWYFWNGKVWEPDMGQTRRLFYTNMLRELSNQARQIQAEHVIKFCARYDTLSHCNSALYFLEATPSMQARFSDFNKAHHLFNFQNGTLDLLTGKLFPHRRTDLLTQISPIFYDPLATAPRWASFINEICTIDAGEETECVHTEMVDSLQVAAGYSLQGTNPEQRLFFLCGRGQNGKSTFINTLAYIFGNYVKSVMTSSFLSTNGQEIRSDLARLRDSRLVISSEFEANQALSVSLIKQLVGGSPITARRLYENETEFNFSAKIWFDSNDLPRITGMDFAMLRRLFKLDFSNIIPMEHRDTELPQKLIQEAPGVFNWLYEGYKKWKQYGLTTFASDYDIKSYYYKMNSVSYFIEQRCDRIPGELISASELYAAYVETCQERDVEKIASATRFGSILRNNYGHLHPKTKIDGRVTYQNLKLKPLNEPIPDESGLIYVPTNLGPE